MFLTTDTLQHQLDELQREGETMGRMDEQRPDSPNMAVNVTEMNERKLTLKIRVCTMIVFIVFVFMVYRFLC